MFHTQNPALIVIDVQHAIDHPRWSGRNNPALEANLAALLGAWRAHRLPVFHVRHASREPGSSYAPDAPGFAFKPQVQPLAGEPVITKHVTSAFIGTDLDTKLHDARISELVITGVVTHNSVDASVRSANNLGYRVWLPADGTAAVPVTAWGGTEYDAEHVHALFLGNLSGEYATITDCRSVIDGLEGLEPTAP